MAAIKHNAHLQAGFTLLEMLVVIAIISIIATVTVLSVSGVSARRMQEEGERLQQVLELAEQESVLRDADIGVMLSANGYGFTRYDDTSRTWQTFPENAFRRRTLPSDLHLSLLQDKPVTLPDGPVEGLSAPALVFAAGGEREPFALLLSCKGCRTAMRIISDGIAPMELWQEDIP